MLKAIVQGEDEYKIELKSDGILLNDKQFSYDLSHFSDNHFHIIFEHQSYNVEVVKADHSRKEYFFKINGKKLEVKLQDRFDQLIEALGMQDDNTATDKQILAPMPGLVLEIHVREGDQIEKGTPLVTLEAMKMENVLKSPSDGKILKIHAGQGKSVEKNYLLLEIE